MQQRTRHASLDFPRSNKRLSPQEEWCEFLSTSMAALTTDDDDNDVGSRSLSSLSGLDLRGNVVKESELGTTGGGSSNNNNSNTAAERHTPRGDGAQGSITGKQRRDSFSESLTSSTGSSPAGSAWRPLGRRASAHLVPSSNQVEHHFDASPFAVNGGNGTGKLPHSSSFRDVVNSCLSSSDSSLVESSSDEEAQEPSGDNNAADRESLRPSIIDVDPAYAASCLPALASLPEDARNLSVDTRGSSVMHAKSPVLGSRKDSQTWQLQDEELLTSPRFGQFRASLDDNAISMFGGGMGLFASEASNDNQVNDVRESRRSTKDVRASSVDFTYSRPNEINPPLPPPQEPLQRLRARSFSYSAGYGPNNYNPAYVNKQYVPHHPPQQDFPATMRQFHAGAPPPPQPSMMPPHASVRPPRVNIPTDSPMHLYHQHQANPPPPGAYRRYSTDFAMPPYPEPMPHEHEVHVHRTPTGRGIRSYSMEYFSSNPRMRTQSLEGNQMFAQAPPPVEYPVVSRHSSGGLTYEWPRSPLGAPPTPPLPPDTHLSVQANSHYPPPPPEAYYEVEFKRGRTEIFAGNAGYKNGDFVKVEADRGEDIGRIGRRISDISKFHSGSNHDGTGGVEDTLGRAKRHELPVKKIISVANARECELLSEQRKEEHDVFEVCKSKVRQRLLPMNVIDAEYQFDRHKLTFFFEADRRIDFRELVRDLFAIYKTRIWLQQVVPSGKKSVGEGESN